MNFLNLLLINPDTLNNFYKSLEIMGLGMLGIFLVMIIIYVVILLLGKINSDSDKGGSDEE